MCWKNNHKQSANIGKNYWDDVGKGVGTSPATAGPKFPEPLAIYSYL